jgi:GT2 family glycosyltransferase
MTDRIGIQIISRDRHSYLAVLLSSLLNQTHKVWDLVIVDNSTNPITNDYLCSVLLTRIQWEGHRVKYIKADPNIRDIGQLRNIALDGDDNPIGTRIDDDSFCDAEYLDKLHAAIIGSPSVGAVGGLVPPMASEKMYAPPATYINKIDEFYDLQGEGDQCYFRNQTKVMEADHLRSSFMYFNEVAKKFRHPECYGKTGYREETDLSYRMRLSGLKLLVVPDAICWHIMAPSGGGRDEREDIRPKNINMFKRRMRECVK